MPRGAVWVGGRSRGEQLFYRQTTFDACPLDNKIFEVQRRKRFHTPFLFFCFFLFLPEKTRPFPPLPSPDRSFFEEKGFLHLPKNNVFLFWQTCRPCQSGFPVRLYISNKTIDYFSDLLYNYYVGLPPSFLFREPDVRLCGGRIFPFLPQHRGLTRLLT